MNRGKPLLIALLIVSLVATAVLRGVAHSRREVILPRPRTVARTAGMDTYAVGLLLGGLRGPLVMFLWSSIENQKMDKDLEDIDTKIEWVRRLQPEFDSVHIFQMWNRAYNLSVMMASLPNKYATILGAIDYGKSVDRERPDNVNVLYAIGDLYFQKLGESAEKPYYIARMREQTKARAVSAARSESGVRRTQHEPLLDERGMILAQYLAARPGAATNQDGYTGAELQYLARYSTPEAGGFPYGISPIAMGYNYFKRAAIVQAGTGRKHLYMSDTVIDSRAGLTLMKWSVEEWLRGRRLECRLLGKPEPAEQNAEYPDIELPTADAKLAAGLGDASEKSRRLAEETLFTYRRAGDVAVHSISEYQRHLKNANFAANVSTYGSHVDSEEALARLVKADRDYLAILAANTAFNPPLVGRDQVDSLRRSAAEQYQLAIDQYYLIILKYYTEDEIAKVLYPRVAGKADADKQNIDRVDSKLYPRIHRTVQGIFQIVQTVSELLQGKKADDNVIREVMLRVLESRKQAGTDDGLLSDEAVRNVIFNRIKEALTSNQVQNAHFSDVFEYETYIERANRRLAELKR